MLDFMALSKALPEITKLVPQAQDFFTAWLEFMNRLGRKQEYAEAKLESIDNKTTFIADQVIDVSEKLTMLMSETNQTPTLLGEVATMADADPRQTTVKWARDTDGNLIGGEDRFL